MTRQSSKTVKTPLRIMKFGGTSVGDACAIQKVLEIIRAASGEGEIVVVVSAMSGVTNNLVDAATQSEAGNCDLVEMIFRELRNRHHAVVSALIHSSMVRSRINREIEQIFQEGERLCQGTALLRELTPRARDSISSLGERLSAPLVAAALTECGLAGEAIEATELIETDSCHGSADPTMDPTRKKCESRLRPLLQKGVVPVVTGFIGATAEGVLTTLGRGGSDYSATILGAALDADEVTIWTDVDGLMTADPRLVPGRPRSRKSPTAKRPNWLTSALRFCIRRLLAQSPSPEFRCGFEIPLHRIGREPELPPRGRCRTAESRD